MFRSHRSFFQLAYEDYINGKSYLFTHAGLVPQWYEKHKDLIGELNVDNLNHLMDSPQGIRALCEVSCYRGGWDQFGSIVWAHIAEIDEIHEALKKDIPCGESIK